MAARSVAIVGGGLSGLVAARELSRSGLFSVVRIFEKSRSNGRLASRRETWQPEGASKPLMLDFDTGAQYFTARSPTFVDDVKRWSQAGSVAEWAGRIAVLKAGVVTETKNKEPRYVGVPNMRGWAEVVAKECTAAADIRYQVRVAALERTEDRAWSLTSEGGLQGDLGHFSHVIIATPAPQAVPLLAGSPKLQETAKGVKMSACWALMLAFDKPLQVDFEGAFVHECEELSWVAVNSSKPGKRPTDPPVQCWMLHGSPAWSNANVEMKEEQVVERLVSAFARALGKDVSELPKPVVSKPFRWRFAAVPEPLTEGFLRDDSQSLFACGDWLNGSRVEGAYMSGYNLSQYLIESLNGGGSSPKNKSSATAASTGVRGGSGSLSGGVEETAAAATAAAAAGSRL